MGYFTERQELIELPSSVDEEKRGKIDSFLGLLEDSGVGPIILSAVKSGTAKGGRPAGNHCLLFAAILYAFAFSKASLRDIESLTRYDLRFAYIMGNGIADHVTVGRLIRDVVTPNAKQIFSSITSAMLRAMKLDGRRMVYVDGTKIEANANKYGFVWKGQAAGKLEGPRGDGAAEIQEAIAQKAIQERGEDLGQDGCLPQGKR